MKVVVYHGERDLRLEEAADPTPGAGEVVVRMRATGVCGTDVHAYQHATSRRKGPLVLGHECAGEVAALGGGVTDLGVGDRVVSHPVWSCGRCDWCLQGLIQFCDQKRVLGINVPGTFAELFVAHHRMIFPLPEGLSYEHAALAEPLACAVRAGSLADVSGAGRILIVGAGTMGLFVLGWIRARTKARITVTDLNVERLMSASLLGADETVVAEELTDEREAAIGAFDVVFEAVGVAETILRAVELAGKHATVVVLGTLAQTPGIPLMKTVSSEVTIRGSYISGLADFREALAALAGDDPPVARLSRQVEPLARTPGLFERLAAPVGGYAKGIVVNG